MMIRPEISHAARYGTKFAREYWWLGQMKRRIAMKWYAIQLALVDVQWRVA
jgi:hypothetical protein